jgi:hypothetical protein
MPQTHCYPTVTVTLLWKHHKIIARQQQLSHYYGNTIKDLICHSIEFSMKTKHKNKNLLESSLQKFCVCTHTWVGMHMRVQECIFVFVFPPPRLQWKNSEFCQRMPNYFCQFLCPKHPPHLPRKRTRICVVLLHIINMHIFLKVNKLFGLGVALLWNLTWNTWLGCYHKN